MYDPLYDAIPQFEQDSGVSVEVVVRLPHPELNAWVNDVFTSGDPDVDLLSTHTKYAPSQARWLSPLDEVVAPEHVADLLPRPLELSRIDGRLLQVPRNIDVRLLHYRQDLLGPPSAGDMVRARGASDGAHNRVDVGLSLSGTRLRIVRHFLRAAGQCRWGTVRRGTSPGVQLSGRRVGGVVHRRSAPGAARDAAGTARLALRRDFGRRFAKGTRRWCAIGRAATISTAIARRAALPIRSASRCSRPVRLASALPTAVATRSRFRVRRAILEAGAELLRFLTSFDAQLGEARRGAIPCRSSALARVREEAEGESSRRGTLAAPGRNRSDDDCPAALRGLPAMRRRHLARRAAGDDWRLVARAGGRAAADEVRSNRRRSSDDVDSASQTGAAAPAARARREVAARERAGVGPREH